eukprot:scaffold3477_cov182-Prasinococcus_capsulatus_cf.AAC.1
MAPWSAHAGQTCAGLPTAPDSSAGCCGPVEREASGCPTIPAPAHHRRGACRRAAAQLPAPPAQHLACRATSGLGRRHGEVHRLRRRSRRTAGTRTRRSGDT